MRIFFGYGAVYTTVGRSFFAAYNFREFREFEAESRKLISRNQKFNSILYGKASPFAKIEIANLAFTKIVRREIRPPYGTMIHLNWRLLKEVTRQYLLKDKRLPPQYCQQVGN